MRPVALHHKCDHFTPTVVTVRPVYLFMIWLLPASSALSPSARSPMTSLLLNPVVNSLSSIYLTSSSTGQVNHSFFLLFQHFICKKFQTSKKFKEQDNEWPSPFPQTLQLLTCYHVTCTPPHACTHTHFFPLEPFASCRHLDVYLNFFSLHLLRKEHLL